MQRRDRVRQAAAAQLPAARGLHRRRRVPQEHLTFEGARKRWGDQLPDNVVERLAYELKVIGDMGVQLLLPDRVGPDPPRPRRQHPRRSRPWVRGGSARSPTLWITDLDPIKYDLLFERFLNPSRISMPDIDMDFDSRYRDEMIRPRRGRDTGVTTWRRSSPSRRSRPPVLRRSRCSKPSHIVGDKVAKAMPPLVMGSDTPLYACLEAPRFVDGYKMAAELRDVRPTPGPGGRRRRQGPRGAATPGRHPRRRGGDHQGAADRVPADPAQARVRHCRSKKAPVVTPVRDARVEARPAQDGLPGPATSTSSPTRSG